MLKYSMLFCGVLCAPLIYIAPSEKLGWVWIAGILYLGFYGIINELQEIKNKIK